MCFIISSSQEEAAALEAANVFAILESGPLVEGVMGQLRHTQNILDDLDESLKVMLIADHPVDACNILCMFVGLHPAPLLPCSCVLSIIMLAANIPDMRSLFFRCLTSSCVTCVMTLLP